MNLSYRLVTQLSSPELRRLLSTIPAKTLLLHRSPNPLVLKHYRGSFNGFAATAESTPTEGRCGFHSLRPAKDSSPPESDGQRGGLPKELSRSVVHLTCESSGGDSVCDVYLIGTSHVSLVSCMEVEAVIRYLKPQVVFLELCASRVAALRPPDSKVAKERGTNGLEFHVAYKEAMKYGARVILGDRPVMEICDADDVRNVLQELAQELPTLSETFINERDRYMSSVLLRIARDQTSVVAVVGKGHLAGMEKHWKQPVTMKDLLSIPNQYSTLMNKFGVPDAGLP